MGREKRGKGFGVDVVGSGLIWCGRVVAIIDLAIASSILLVVVKSWIAEVDRRKRDLMLVKDCGIWGEESYR